jgi:hypothetical protein
MRIRLHFIDGSSGHFYDPRVTSDHKMLQAVDSESKLNTWIPMHRVHKWVELSEAVHKD